MVVFLASGGGCCCNNYGVRYLVPVYSRHQSSESAREKKNGEILVLTPPKADDQIFQERNKGRTQVSTASIRSSCNFNWDAHIYQRQRDLGRVKSNGNDPEVRKELA